MVQATADQKLELPGAGEPPSSECIGPFASCIRKGNELHDNHRECEGYLSCREVLEPLFLT